MCFCAESTLTVSTTGRATTVSLLRNRRITESLRLEKPSEIPQLQAQPQPNPTMPTDHVPECHISAIWNTSKTGDPTTPWAAVAVPDSSFREEFFPKYPTCFCVIFFSGLLRGWISHKHLYSVHLSRTGPHVWQIRLSKSTVVLSLYT